VAEDVMDKAAADAKRVSPNGMGTTIAARPESRADRARRLAYRSRFAAFYVLLAVVAGAGVGTLLVLVGRGSPAPAPAWSAWQPTGSVERRAAQIADHVSDPYRLPSGKPLVGVRYGPPTLTLDDGTMFQVLTIAVAPDTAGGGAESTDIDTFDASSTIMYTLCGLGSRCSIPEGKPSTERGQLLRRQALELALYSFRYLEGIDSVVVALPPRADGRDTIAVFLTRSDLRAELSKPLSETLTAPLTPGVGEILADEQRVIDRVTNPRLYEYAYLRAQDGSAVMALTPALSG
jgi:hypothetical protein